MLREEWVAVHAARLSLWGLVEWNGLSQYKQPAPVTCKAEICILYSVISPLFQPYHQYLKCRLNVFCEILLFIVFIYFKLLIS